MTVEPMADSTRLMGKSSLMSEPISRQLRSHPRSPGYSQQPSVRKLSVSALQPMQPPWRRAKAEPCGPRGASVHRCDGSTFTAVAGLSAGQEWPDPKVMAVNSVGAIEAAPAKLLNPLIDVRYYLLQ